MPGSTRSPRPVTSCSSPTAATAPWSPTGHSLLAVPRGRDGGWPGYEPVDGTAAVSHLEAQRAGAPRWFVLPKPRRRLAAPVPRAERPPQAGPPAGAPRRAPGAVGPRRGPVRHRSSPTIRTPRARARHLRRGPQRPGTGLPPSSSRPAGAGRSSSGWRAAAGQPTGAEADATGSWSTTVPCCRPGSSIACSPPHATLDVDRMQPTHRRGPAAGPPVTERHAGTVAREVDDRDALPVLSIRRRGDADGPGRPGRPVTIGLDAWPVQPSPATASPAAWELGPGRRAGVSTGRARAGREPRISVLITTYDRPELLRACLDSFAEQTLDRSRFEVVVVDDGSRRRRRSADHARRARPPGLQVVGRAHRPRRPLRGQEPRRHARPGADRPVLRRRRPGRAGLPRAPPRRPRRASPADAVAVLGHTDWAPELERRR